MPNIRLASWLLAPCAGLFLFLALPWPIAAARPRSETRRTAPSTAVRAAGRGAALGKGALRSTTAQGELGPMSYDANSGRYVSGEGAGRKVLSVSPRLQQGLERLLAEYRLPMGAAVLLDPKTGRVLAMAEHAERGVSGHVALRPIAPAASVFKIVTSAALLERGIQPDSEVCFHGGNHRIQKALLRDDPRRDRNCLSLASALGKSANVVFAKLAERDLSAPVLQAEADRFLFNTQIPFEWTVEPSPAHISEDPFDFATTAAGFGPVRLSPLHGALIAAIVANGGKLVPPSIVANESEDPDVQARQVIRPEVAASLARMMEHTVTEGTARKIFRRDRALRSSPLREVTVAGKTGSLAEADPHRDYSWFIGFAPVEDPQVAVAAVVMNERLWRVKAPFVAHEALAAFFAQEGGRGMKTAVR